jgi:hypothetical protein
MKAFEGAWGCSLVQGLTESLTAAAQRSGTTRMPNSQKHFNDPDEQKFQAWSIHACMGEEISSLYFSVCGRNKAD